MTRWIIDRASREDAGAIVALLHDARLPTEDLASAQPTFWVARARAGLPADIAAIIGLETFDSTGLLRSLAVRESARRVGLGSQLVAHVESQARAAGLAQLVLLTTTAADFFATQGFAVTPREALPARVLASSEFQTICPATAVAMSKRVAPS